MKLAAVRGRAAVPTFSHRERRLPGHDERGELHPDGGLPAGWDAAEAQRRAGDRTEHTLEQRPQRALLATDLGRRK
jgi:hypothetical protein